jgi:hypothetical protein
MCPSANGALPWVGDYNPEATADECPRCGSGVGIFAVEEDGFPRDEATRAAISAVVKAGKVDRFDGGAGCSDAR